MAPSCSLRLVARDGVDGEGAVSTNHLNATLIVGIVIACVIAAGAAVWLGIHFYRKRCAAKREDALGSSFITVRGVTKDGLQENSVPSNLDVQSKNMFSRAQITVSVVMPEKAVLRQDATRDEIINHYSAEGRLPRPFAPFAFNDASKSLEPPSRDSIRPASASSFLSVMSGSFRNSIASSRRCSTASTVSILDPSHKRKVRQLFSPTLPDELVLSLGERVTVVQSYDDGWCIVGRDSVFKPGEVELGAVPAWCFVKPVKGLKAERPIRTTSLGVTVTLDAPGASREDVISWSNF
ncbi:hypothetical protein AcV5_008623 [Taiwanofungus camphoratus]|nr:hypothetical protein AcV5_008623 [Antrodia cinnamomea]